MQTCERLTRRNIPLMTDTFSRRASIKFASVVLLVFLFSCSTASARENPKDAVQEVSFCDLVKTPSAFSGKRIRVRAIYRYAFEIQRLEPPTCCQEPAVNIWVEIDSELQGKSRRLFSKFPKGQGLVLASFVGRIDSGSAYGTFADRYKLTVDKIDKVERTSRSSRKQDATYWAPKNCGETGVLPTK
jgi:hypothetical protein